MNIIEQIDKQMALLSEIKDIAQRLPELSYRGGVRDELRIEVHSLDELHEMRTILREGLGKWTDELNMIFCCLGRGIAIYKSHIWPIAIWLSTPQDKFPPELIGDGCGFKKITCEDYRYVCEPKP